MSISLGINIKFWRWFLRPVLKSQLVTQQCFCGAHFVSRPSQEAIQTNIWSIISVSCYIQIAPGLIGFKSHQLATSTVPLLGPRRGIVLQDQLVAIRIRDLEKDPAKALIENLKMWRDMRTVRWLMRKVQPIYWIEGVEDDTSCGSEYLAHSTWCSNYLPTSLSFPTP